MRAALVASALSLAAPIAAGELTLTLPIDCIPGETCYIQNFMDRDPTEQVRDFQCGSLSYDGHKGTDFALPALSDMQWGVNVLAAAPGMVAAVRDGMPDVLFDPASADRIRGKECGNGVLLRHPDGWETQYCHMKSGSVRVRSGDPVEAGTILGQVGLSGKTTFPHVHLSVRRDGRRIDPFDPDSDADLATCTPPERTLWRDTLDYVPGGLISAGFAQDMPGYDAIKAGTAARDRLPRTAPALVLFGFAYGGRTGDEIDLQITGPDGPVLTERVELNRNQGQFFRAAGKRLRSGRWAGGAYHGTVRILRDGQELSRKMVQVTLE